jgi:single-stranded DNA-binding protein
MHMPDTTTTIVGNLTDNPEIRYTENGITRARFGWWADSSSEAGPLRTAAPGPLWRS